MYIFLHYLFRAMRYSSYYKTKNLHVQNIHNDTITYLTCFCSCLLHYGVVIMHFIATHVGPPRQLSRYTDSLRAGRSGDQISVGARFSAAVQTGPGAHPASCTTGTVSFPGVKRPGRGASHPIPSSCQGSRTGRATPLLPLLGPQGLLQGEPLPLP
jgi:hypothetical protein